MRHAVIMGHPNPASFNAGVAASYVEAVRELGHTAGLRDLYAQGFQPCLQACELPWRDDFAAPADVEAERQAIADTDVIVLVYPLWFNAPPAIIKGYVERVFGLGFGYSAAAPGTRPLLAGKRLVSVTTSGAPGAWVDQTGAMDHLRKGFDEHVAAVCGLSVLEHLHLGGVTPGIRADAAEAMFDEVRAMARRLFAPAEAASGPALR
jgi:NAD(P)H dehydrogenase (quinone)